MSKRALKVESIEDRQEAAIDKIEKLAIRMEEMMSRIKIIGDSDELTKREAAVTVREVAIGHIKRTKQQAVDAGMKIIVGKKGGLYYISKGGNRVYVKDE